LDAWVFKDELEFWCKKGYDYIGAPWTGIHPYENERLLGVGNSGFSIRSIRNSIRTLKNIEILAILNQYKHYNWKGLLPRLPLLLFKLMVPFKYSKTSYGFDINEDLFWCKYAPSLLDQIKYDSLILELAARLFIKNNFKIAPEEIALQFSFETEGRKFYKLNNEKLPFGCHGWEKYEPDFWKEFIPVPIKDYSKGFDHN
jgi:hypothetical protein